MTTTDDKGKADTTAGTSAPGVTTAPGETSAGGRDAKAHHDTTVGHDTSTAAGQKTTGGHGTNTTVGETNETGAVQETETVVCPPDQPPPPEQPPPPPPEQVTPPPPGVTPPPPGVTPPPPTVQGVQVRPATARLSAPAGCPPQRFFARVTGRGIARVVFTLDGRRLRTLTRPDAVGVWKVRIDTRRYSTGKHRIVARVTFRASSSALRQSNPRTSKTMSITFTKCARKASRPTFTG